MSVAGFLNFSRHGYGRRGTARMMTDADAQSEMGMMINHCSKCIRIVKIVKLWSYW